MKRVGKGIYDVPGGVYYRAGRACPTLTPEEWTDQANALLAFLGAKATPTQEQIKGLPRVYERRYAAVNDYTGHMVGYVALEDVLALFRAEEKPVDGLCANCGKMKDQHQTDGRCWDDNDASWRSMRFLQKQR